MKKPFIECGKIVATQGVKGEVRIQPWCDAPDFLLDFDAFYLDGGERELSVEYSRAQKNIVIIKFGGIDSIDQAVTLRGQVIYLRREDVPLEPDECFVQDILGCTVIDADTGADYGKIYDVRPTGANDVYYLRDDAGAERLVPVIPSVVLEKDVDAGIIKIRPLEGLFE